MGSAVRKHILNNSKLVEIKDEDEKEKTWLITIPLYAYYYFDHKVAHVSFSGSICEVSVHETFAPWAHLLNNQGDFFAKVSIVEDQLHGVNIIEMDNLQALFVEMETNLNLEAGKAVINTYANSSTLTAKAFAQSIQQNFIQAQQSMTNVSKKTFPMWGKK